MKYLFIMIQTLFVLSNSQIAFTQTPPNQVTQIPVGDQSNLEKPLDIQIILDLSGSMNALMDGTKKIDAARNALASTLNDIPANTEVAFRVYGNNYSIKQKDLSCQDSTLLIPFSPVNKSQFVTSANQLIPNGMTPIAFSLEKAALDLQTRAQNRHMIILISDGEETCEGDPAAVAAKMKANGIDVKIYSIGFGVNDIARQQLQGVSMNTGGKYFDANSIQSLQESLKQISQETVPQKAAIIERKGNFKVKGGDNYETAVPIDANMLGEEFSFTHHIKKGAPEFFYIDVPAGYTLKVTGSTGENAVEIDEFNQATEKNNGDPFLYVEVEDFDRKMLASIYTHDANFTRWIRIPSFSKRMNTEHSRYYIVVGKKEGNYNDIHKNSRIKVELIDHTDANTQTDASEDVMSNPPTIEIDQEYTAHLSDNDKEDVFKISGFKKGEVLELFAIPMDPNSRLTMEGIYDSYRTEIGRAAYPPNDGAPVKTKVTIPQDGDLFIKFKFSWHGDHITKYKFKVSKLDVSSAPTEKNSPPTYQPKTKNNQPDMAKQLKVKVSGTKTIVTEEKAWKYFFKKPVLITLLIQDGIILLLILSVYLLAKSRSKYKKMTQKKD